MGGGIGEIMNDTLKTIQQLRSIRSFIDKPLKDEELDTIVNASIRAANSSARQCYSIVVLKDQQKMQAIFGYQGAAALVYCVDYNRIQDIATHLGEVNLMSAPIDFITGSTDAVLAAQTAVIAAKSMGIDSLITNGVHRKDLNTIQELLQLPKQYCYPLIAVVLGYSEVEVDHVKERIVKGVIHQEIYHRLTAEEIEEEIETFDQNDKKYGLTTYTQWKTMGFKHYYQWFFQKWIGRQEDKFSPALRTVKFLD